MPSLGTSGSALVDKFLELLCGKLLFPSLCTEDAAELCNTDSIALLYQFCVGAPALRSLVLKHLDVGKFCSKLQHMNPRLRVLSIRLLLLLLPLKSPHTDTSYGTLFSLLHALAECTLVPANVVWHAEAMRLLKFSCRDSLPYLPLLDPSVEMPVSWCAPAAGQGLVALQRLGDRRHCAFYKNDASSVSSRPVVFASSKAIPVSASLFYMEVTLRRLGRTKRISIGLIPRRQVAAGRQLEMPGYQEGSYGWNAATGHRYNSSTRGQGYREAATDGQVIGLPPCGVRAARSRRTTRSPTLSSTPPSSSTWHSCSTSRTPRANGVIACWALCASSSSVCS